MDTTPEVKVVKGEEVKTEVKTEVKPIDVEKPTKGKKVAKGEELVFVPELGTTIKLSELNK